MRRRFPRPPRPPRPLRVSAATGFTLTAKKRCTRDSYLFAAANTPSELLVVFSFYLIYSRLLLHVYATTLARALSPSASHPHVWHRL
ncbi:hypothetical protein ALC56_05170 [Trachymyrmex septentrionalis]|uniref:Uncharacterized protein n=1 Tax=Trachymyrmex septentrionalis TaxID=34720 RepID=A0A195FHQ2_9HYME|nr:hypothetical protein ALC56_05170 [Trachymyrmex septentrionalis]